MKRIIHDVAPDMFWLRLSANPCNGCIAGSGLVFDYTRCIPVCHHHSDFNIIPLWIVDIRSTLPPCSLLYILLILFLSWCSFFLYHPHPPSHHPGALSSLNSSFLCSSSSSYPPDPLSYLPQSLSYPLRALFPSNENWQNVRTATVNWTSSYQQPITIACWTLFDAKISYSYIENPGNRLTKTREGSNEWKNQRIGEYRFEWDYR